MKPMETSVKVMNNQRNGSIFGIDHASVTGGWLIVISAMTIRVLALAQTDLEWWYTGLYI